LKLSAETKDAIKLEASNRDGQCCPLQIGFQLGAAALHAGHRKLPNVFRQAPEGVEMDRRIRGFLIILLIASLAWGGAAMASSTRRVIQLRDGDDVHTGTPWACSYQSAKASPLGRASLLCGYGPKNHLVVQMVKGEIEVDRFEGAKIKTLFRTKKVR